MASSVICLQPGDWRLQKLLADFDLKIELRADRHFLCPDNAFLDFADKNPNLVLTKLWDEFDRHDEPRTRFALWEFYRRYPLVGIVPIEVGSSFPIDVEFAPDGRNIATAWNDGGIVLYDADIR